MHAINQASTQSSSAVAATPDLSSENLQSMMMSVLQGRSDSLTNSLQQQLQGMQTANTQANALNTAMADMTKVNGYFSSTSDATKGIPSGNQKDAQAAMDAAQASCKAAGIDYTGPTNAKKATLGDITTATASLKASLDNVTNVGQTNQLSVQTLMGKVNDSTSTESDLLKKMQDMSSGIISNYR